MTIPIMLASKTPDLRFALWDFYAQSSFESQVILQRIAALQQRMQSFRAWGEFRRGARTQARPSLLGVGLVLCRPQGTGRGRPAVWVLPDICPILSIQVGQSPISAQRWRGGQKIAGPLIAGATYTQEGTAVTSIIAERPEGRAEARFIAMAALVPTGGPQTRPEPVHPKVVWIILAQLDFGQF